MAKTIAWYAAAITRAEWTGAEPGGRALFVVVSSFAMDAAARCCRCFCKGVCIHTTCLIQVSFLP